MEKQKLSFDELSEVTGGTAKQIAEDSQFLNSLGNYCDRYGEWRGFWSDEVYNDVTTGWAKVGVKVKLNNGLLLSSKYYIDGYRVTREEAFEHALAYHNRKSLKQ